MTAARNPRTGRFERDPLTSPDWPVPAAAPTPIWDALMAEKADPLVLTGALTITKDA